MSGWIFHLKPNNKLRGILSQALSYYGLKVASHVVEQFIRQVKDIQPEIHIIISTFGTIGVMFKETAQLFSLPTIPNCDELKNYERIPLYVKLNDIGDKLGLKNK